MSKTKGIVLGEGHVNHIKSNGAFVGLREGYAAIPPKGPDGYSGTVNKQFEGAQETNRQNGATGTPANNVLGNPDEALRVRSSGKYGVSPIAGGRDANLNDGEGDATMFAGVTREAGYNPKAAPAMDSPVMRGAPEFQTRTIKQENLAHLGQGIGADPAQAGDDLMKIAGGVMSRD